jgi:hypothetical protein
MVISPQYVKSAQDMYRNRAFLKNLPYCDYTIAYLANFLVSAIEKGERFRQLDCLKIIRSIIRQRCDDTRLGRTTTSLLFSLYRNYIFHHNEEVQWCVSTLIKDQILDDEYIEWLVAHYQETNHIVNRLLRYPERHKLIVRWATKVYKNNELNDRSSEIIALLIGDNIPDFINEANSNTVLWGIYYARSSAAIKRRLLIQHANFDNLEHVLNISMRLEIPEVIEHMLNQIPPEGAHVE